MHHGGTRAGTVDVAEERDNLGLFLLRHKIQIFLQNKKFVFLCEGLQNMFLIQKFPIMKTPPPLIRHNNQQFLTWSI